MKHLLLGAHTGLPVSEFALGAASFGSRKGYGASASDIALMLSAYADAGGNFIDIADQYQLGEAEEIVGRFVASKRHDFIICTKYTRSNEINPTAANEGNHRKAMRSAVEASLKRLKTDYIDIYMPHYDDGRTPVEEIARGLEDLVKSGKILYPGLANFPAWKAAAIASVIPLFTLQFEYNLSQRAADRELIPMADYFGLGKMFYSPLAGGLLTGKYRHGDKGRLTLSAKDPYQEDPATKSIIDQLELIASEVDATAGQVALAWALTKNGIPIIGARSISHLEEALKATSIQLSVEQLTQLENLSGITKGYPHDLLKTVQRVY
jgi:aryl-alcohol dehydrogenase-like predicted oxidoreductase